MNGQNVQATEIIDNLKKTCCIRFEETESEKLIPAIRHVLSATEIFIFLRSNKTIREKQNFVEDVSYIKYIQSFNIMFQYYYVKLQQHKNIILFICFLIKSCFN
uniref:Uncharacterized protein n=1 Tax=Clastoptera arizonana TaxID=38151 RepID=A0A1B6CR57_9HEMI